MTAITLNDLTTGATDGTGVFDKLMAACKAHLEDQFRTGAIKGTDYATVYLGLVQGAMQTGLQFLATNQKIDLEAQLLQKQIDLAQSQIDQAKAQTDLVRAQIAAADSDRDLAVARAAQVRAETLNVPKQGQLLDAQVALSAQQKLNAVQEGKNLVAQECLLKAQFDGTLQTTLKSAAETDLLKQKVVTEKAQTLELGVDANSVIGKQKTLYQAQIDGFKSDRLNKGAKLLVDTWNARRMTDDATSANSTNMLDDSAVGRAVKAVLTDMGA